MFRRTQLVPILAAVVVVIWTVWLASCSDEGTVESVKLRYRVHDANLKAGYYCLCWNQHNQQGIQVKAGAYQAHMEAGLFDTTIAFAISGASSSVAAPACCDSATVGALKPAKDPPTKFRLALNAAAYAAGDSIAIEFDLPVSCNCLIRIEER